ncbi:paraquat-inducible protein A [Ciceribacter sp. L1K22]|nr:paraquat-inducible protein A [Ciceribacter sp. L1K22]
MKRGRTLAMIWLRATLLVAAPFCLALGFTLPLLRLETFYVVSRTPSLVEIVGSLWSGGDYVLASLVAVLSMVLPTLKLMLLAAEAIGQRASPDKSGHWQRLLPHLARWSMMDVMLVAIVIFAAKSSGLASAFTQPGLWFFAVSAMIAGVLPAVLKSGMNKADV